MKGFFKVLAVVLSLVIIMDCIPAVAASDPVLSMADDKTLYLDGAKGFKESDGSTCGVSYKKKVPNMIVGYDFDKMSISLKSSDTEVVRISKKEYIVAESIGKATVTVTVYNKNKKKIFKHDLLVIVKKNADKVFVEGIKDGGTYITGQILTVGLPTYDKDTDHRELLVDNPDMVEISSTEATNTWAVKFLTPGEVTFTGRAYQSSVYTGTTAETKFAVNVVEKRDINPENIEVVEPNAIKVTFKDEEDAKWVQQNNIWEVFKKYLGNKQQVLGSSGEVSGNSFLIYFSNNLTSDFVYYLQIGDGEPIRFVREEEKKEDVALTITEIPEPEGGYLPIVTSAPQVTPPPLVPIPPGATSVPGVSPIPKITSAPEVSSTPEITSAPETSPTPEITPTAPVYAGTPMGIIDNVSDDIVYYTDEQIDRLEVQPVSIPGSTMSSFGDDIVELSYQWYKAEDEVSEGIPIDGATGSMYTPDVDTSSMAFYYYAKLTNSDGDKIPSSADTNRIKIHFIDKQKCIVVHYHAPDSIKSISPDDNTQEERVYKYQDEGFWFGLFAVEGLFPQVMTVDPGQHYWSVTPEYDKDYFLNNILEFGKLEIAEYASLKRLGDIKMDDSIYLYYPDELNDDSLVYFVDLYTMKAPDTQ